jgi:ACS family pantothenate transporter-like MFS transporter
VIGVAQTLGEAFIAWVPGRYYFSLSSQDSGLLILCLVVILNVSKYAPKFKMGFTVMSVLSLCEFGMIFVIKYFVDRNRKKTAIAEGSIGGGESEEEEPVAQEK